MTLLVMLRDVRVILRLCIWGRAKMQQGYTSCNFLRVAVEPSNFAQINKSKLSQILTQRKYLVMAPT